MRNFLLSFLILGLTTGAWGGMYQSFEDPQKGSENLKNWRIPQPIPEDQWESIVGERSSNKYSVKSGDTLSKISKKQLGSEDYWPKLWEVNKAEIDNPHLIEPRQKLAYSNKAPSPRNISSETAVPIPFSGEDKSFKKSQVAPAKEIPDQLIRPRLANSHRLRFFFLGDEEMLGILTGAYDRRENFLAGQEVYVGAFDKNKVIPGKKYTIVRELSASQASMKAGSQLGTLIQVVGEIQVERYGDDLAIGSIVQAFDRVQRGDRIAELPPVTTQEKPEAPPASLSSKIVLGELLEKSFASQGNLVVLDKGQEAGMKNGFVFKVFDDTDPNTKKQQLVEPRSKGEVRIVFVGKRSSVGLVTKCREPLEAGNVLLSSHLLADSDRSVRKPTAVMKFD